MRTSLPLRPPQQFWGFLAVGAVNTLWAYALFAFFIFVGLHYTLATLLAGVISVLSGYAAQRRLVFAYGGGGRLLRFVAGFALVYLANIGIQRVLLETVPAAGHYGAGAVATVACAFLGYFVNSRFVFR